MIARYLNWILVASCSVFLMIGIYSSRLTKICLIIAIAAYFLIKLLDNNRLLFKNLFEYTALNKAIFCFLIVSILSTIFGIAPYHSQQVLFNRYIIYFFVFFIGAFLGKKKTNINILLLALLAGSLVLSFGCVADAVNAGRLKRMVTSFEVGFAGVYFLYVLPFFIGLIFFQPSLKLKIYSIVISIPVLIIFLFHGSKGAWLGFLAGLIITIILVNKHRRRLIGLILLLVLIFTCVPFLRGRVFKDSHIGTVDVRFQMWNASFNIFKRYPLLGAGPGNYGTLMYDFYPDEFIGGRIHMHAHNIYAEVLADMGVFGLLSFLWIFSLFFIKGYKSIKINWNFYNVSFIMMFVSVLVSEFFMSVILVGITQPVIFWFLLGLGATSFMNCSKDKIIIQ